MHSCLKQMSTGGGGLETFSSLQRMKVCLQLLRAAAAPLDYKTPQLVNFTGLGCPKELYIAAAGTCDPVSSGEAASPERVAAAACALIQLAASTLAAPTAKHLPDIISPAALRFAQCLQSLPGLGRDIDLGAVARGDLGQTTGVALKKGTKQKKRKGHRSKVGEESFNRPYIFQTGRAADPIVLHCCSAAAILVGILLSCTQMLQREPDIKELLQTTLLSSQRVLASLRNDLNNQVFMLLLLREAVSSEQPLLIAAVAAQVVQAPCPSVSDALATVALLGGHDSAHSIQFASQEMTAAAANLLLGFAVLRHLVALPEVIPSVLLQVCLAMQSLARLWCSWKEVALIERLLRWTNDGCLEEGGIVEFVEDMTQQALLEPQHAHRNALQLADKELLLDLDACSGTVFGIHPPLPLPIPDTVSLLPGQLPLQWGQVDAPFHTLSSDTKYQPRQAAVPTQAGGCTEAAVPLGKKSRPHVNAFVSVRLSSPALHAHALRLQGLVTGMVPALQAACTPVAKQHLTLFMLCLASEEETQKAKSVLADAQVEVASIFASVLDVESRRASIQVKGLKVFSGRVLAFDVLPDATIAALRLVFELLHARFTAAGLSQVAAKAIGLESNAALQPRSSTLNWARFQRACAIGKGTGLLLMMARKAARKWEPHSTIMKLSNLRHGTRRDATTLSIPTQYLCSQGEDVCHFAEVSFDRIEISSMRQAIDETGFYKQLASIVIQG
jgi:hypothetical protein